VRIGDRVWAFSTTDNSFALLVPGLVDMIQTRPDGMPQAFRVGMEAGGLGSGGPLFNDLGEVIGILAIADDGTGAPSGSILAFTCDTISGDR
jgi:molecular chaperone DnaK